MIPGAHTLNIAPADRARKEADPAAAGVQRGVCQADIGLLCCHPTEFEGSGAEANHERSGDPHTRILPSPDEGERVSMGGLGVRFMIGSAQSWGTFALVEHPIGPRVLASSLHTHEREDEYTYVLEG